MAATPPLQITGSPRTPPTPLHGASYDHEESPRRTSARLRQKRAHESIATQTTTRPTRLAKTPTSPRTSLFEPRSPDQTPQRKSTARRVQVMSPTSPDSDASAPKPTTSRTSNTQPFLTTTTTFTEGMLPTPVKTPSKKHKMISKSNIAARALFQDLIPSDEVAQSPKRARKNKRFNGFSLESFRADNGNNPSGVQIFTDSRDQVPEIDRDEDNPFADHEGQGPSSESLPKTVKRRKVSNSRRLDPQVEEALEQDDGMVYVFRGKKVYRRFDDTGEEEEEIDLDDLGLLEGISGGERVARPLRTLTRKSIKPTRLFQTEAQKREREREKEEEATTDIDDTAQLPPSYKKTFERAEEEVGNLTRATRGKARAVKTNHETTEVSGKASGKKTSPFDAWPRVKPGSATSSGIITSTRGRKRAASPSFERQPAGTRAT